MGGVQTHLVISLKPKVKADQFSVLNPLYYISLNHKHSTINPLRVSYKEDPKPLNLSQPILNMSLAQLSQT